MKFETVLLLTFAVIKVNFVLCNPAPAGENIFSTQLRNQSGPPPPPRWGQPRISTAGPASNPGTAGYADEAGLFPAVKIVENYSVTNVERTQVKGWIELSIQ